MMRTCFSWLLSSLALLAIASSAQAHFLWVVADPASGEAKVYFSEDAEPDDPALLSRLKDLKLVLLEGRDKQTEAAATKKEDALVAPLGKAYAVTMSHPYGVMERGGEKFLLVYHGSTQVSPVAADWKRVGGEKTMFEIVPSSKEGRLVLTVTWQGKPLADAQIVATGAGHSKLEGKTDAEGKFVVAPKQAGLIAVRAKHVETKSGKLEDKAYDSVRHWTTLTVPVNVPTVTTIDTQLPELPVGITSFGAAIIGDHAYVFGGHLGGAHHYWKDGQSNQLLRLNVNDGKSWEKLAEGPRRTGTAMVSHGGKLYRIGGFEARNAESEEADLHSMEDVEQYDPAVGKWEAFVKMPVPRSSHDACVLGSTIYVVGGWNLQKRGSGEFLDSMLALDLAAQNPAWKVIQMPFKRRALSAAAHGGKIYAIGGMTDGSGPSTAVDVYDPATKTWSKAPALHGQPMEGFGNTSFEIGGKLTAVTRGGAIQQLSADGKAWVIAGYLRHPRFFGRLLPLGKEQGVMIGGADMGSGKINRTEILSAAK